VSDLLMRLEHRVEALDSNGMGNRIEAELLRGGGARNYRAQAVGTQSARFSLSKACATLSVS
jgi:hypothetical protein